MRLLLQGFLIKKASGFPFNWLRRYCAFYGARRRSTHYCHTHIILLPGSRHVLAVEEATLCRAARPMPLHASRLAAMCAASTGTLAYYVTEAESVTRQNIKGQRAQITSVERFAKEEFGLIFHAKGGKPLLARAADEAEQEQWIEVITKHFEVC